MFTKISRFYVASDVDRTAIWSAAAVRRAAGWALWVFDAVPETLIEWQRRHQDRQALASLDDRLLRDVGISPAEAAREAAKPFWRA